MFIEHLLVPDFMEYEGSGVETKGVLLICGLREAPNGSKPQAGWAGNQTGGNLSEHSFLPRACW